jgi:hypothetical protein
LISACRFNRPLLSFRINKGESYNADSSLYQKKKRCFFFCLRICGIIGSYQKTIQYYPSGQIKFIALTKFISYKAQDAPYKKRCYRKKLSFNEYGKMTEKKLSISQMRKNGKCGIILDKTVMIDSVGIKTIIKMPRSVTFPFSN